MRKLRDAGAVFLGKLNMHEFAYGGTSAVTHYGPVHNPWNLDVQPRRLVGRLGRRGRGAALRGGARHGHGCVGALSGRVLRCRGAQGDAWAREHSRHRAALGAPRSRRPARAQRRRLRARDDGARGLRSARSREHPWRSARTITPRSGARCVSFASAFRARRFSSSSIPRSTRRCGPRSRCSSASRGPTRDVTIAAPNTYALLDAETYAYHAPLLADPAKRALYTPLTLQRIMGGASVTAQVYIEQRRRMQIARNTIDDVFADVDVLVAPTCMALPKTIDEVRRESGGRAIADPQHAAVQRLRHSGDQRAVRLHARGACRSACRSSVRGSAKRPCSRSLTPTSRRRTGTGASRRSPRAGQTKPSAAAAGHSRRCPAEADARARTGRPPFDRPDAAPGRRARDLSAVARGVHRVDRGACRRRLRAEPAQVGGRTVAGSDRGIFPVRDAGAAAARGRPRHVAGRAGAGSPRGTRARASAATCAAVSRHRPWSSSRRPPSNRRRRSPSPCRLLRRARTSISTRRGAVPRIR